MPERILIVDDDIDTVRLVGLMLERQGYEILAASNGEQAITSAKREQPDLILLDIMMPDIDGYEVARQLREDHHTTHLPIIMFTAKNQVDDKLQGFEVGADDYLTKPIQPGELLGHIKTVLARSSHLIIPPSKREAGSSTAVLAAKGGLGVTTLALNLGIAIRNAAKKDVILAEFRPGLGSLSLELGYTKKAGLANLLKAKPDEITYNAIEKELVTHGSGIYLLLSSYDPKDAQYMFATRPFEAIARQLTQFKGQVIFDLGAGLTPVAQKVIKYCNSLILVVEPTPHVAFQSKMFIQELRNIGFRDDQIKVVLVNRVTSSVQLSWTQVQDQIGINLAAVFTPAPELAYQASVNKIPIIAHQPDSLTADQFQKLAVKMIQGSLVAFE